VKEYNNEERIVELEDRVEAQENVLQRLDELRTKEEEEKAKQARLQLLEERDVLIQAWCFKNGYRISNIDKEHSDREKEKNIPWNYTYHVCRKENIAHQVSYYSDEFAMIMGIE
jgi:hypothetical protein